jgi:TRAP-type C4-dicarboxylate transport system substrate-binding protein
MRRSSLLTTALLTASFALAAGPTQAETIKITAIAGPPPVAANTKMMKNVFVPTVNKILKEGGGKYNIEWTQGYGQSLAKIADTFEAVEEGIAQVGMIIFVFEESKMPMEQYTFSIPFGASDTKTISTINSKLRQKIPEMNAHWGKFNQEILSFGAELPWHIYTKFPIKSYKDLKGHKIGSSGSAGNLFRGTGAVVVNDIMHNSFNNIKNGLYDGYPSSIGLGFVYKIFAAAPYITQVNFGARMGAGISVNKKEFAKWPQPVQKAFRIAAKAWTGAYHKVSNILENKFMGIMKKKGATITPFSSENRKAWAHSLPNIAKQWAADLDKKGLPGTKILNTYMAELRAAGVKPARDWDK